MKININNFLSYDLVSKIPNNANYSFTKCIFASTHEATPISADSVSGALSLRECCFVSILGDVDGSCIHVNCESNSMDIALTHVIASKCMSRQNEGSFAYIISTGKCCCTNTVIDKCAPESTSYYHAMDVVVEAFNNNGGNMTNCLCRSDLVSIATPNSKLEWFQFINNICSQHVTLLVRDGNYEMNYLSFIGSQNLSPTTSGCTLYIYNTTTALRYSFFSQNKGGYLITVQLSNCKLVECTSDSSNLLVNAEGKVDGNLKADGTQPIPSVIYMFHLDDCLLTENLNAKQHVLIP